MTHDESPRRHLRDFSALSASNLFVALASFVGVALLARLESSQVLGQVVFAQASAATVFAFLDVRFEDAVMHFLPKLELSTKSAASGLYMRLLGLDILLGLGCAAAAAGLVVTHVVGTGSATEPGLLVVALLDQGVRAPIGTSIAGFSTTNGLTQLSQLSSAFAAGGAMAAIGGLLVGGPTGYLLGSGVVGLAQATTLGILSRRRVLARYGAPGKLPSGLGPAVGRFAAVTSLSGTAYALPEVLPLTLVGGIAGPTQLGLVRAALAPVRLLRAAAVAPMVSVAFPQFAGAAARGAYPEIRSAIARWLKAGIAAGLVIAVIGWVCMPLAIRVVFGDEFGASVFPARLLLVAGVTQALVAWSKVLPIAVGRPVLRLIGLVVEGGLLSLAAGLFASNLSRLGASYIVVAGLLAVGWLLVAHRLLGRRAGADR